MAERRKHKRWSRRVRVRYWPKGFPSKATSGYTSDLSEGGTFVVADRPLRQGSRVQIEFLTDDGGFLLEGIVARSLTYPRELLKVRTAGMGIRFLTVRELVGELFPTAATDREGSARPRAEEPDSLRDVLESGARRSERSARRPNSSSSSSPPPAAIPSEPSSSDSKRFPVRFESQDQLFDSWDKDLQYGGLFVSTAAPAALDSEVELVLQLPHRNGSGLHLKARVVHVHEPESGSRQENLLAGMGVHVIDPEALARLAEAIGELRGLDI
jgi:Tfp pilus assembly protein PilZ